MGEREVQCVGRMRAQRKEDFPIVAKYKQLGGWVKPQD